MADAEAELRDRVAQQYPQYAVSRWVGHSISVSGRHYANVVPAELLARVTGRPRKARLRQQPRGAMRIA